MTVSCSKLVLLLVGPLLAIGVANMITGGGGGMNPFPFSSPSTSVYYNPSAFTTIFGPLSIFYSLVARGMYRLRRSPEHSPYLEPLAAGDSMAHRKMVIVTGANTGIGYETAKSLVQRHHMTVVLACRSRDKAFQAAERINTDREHHPFDGAASKTTFRGQAIVLTSPLDLSSPQSISKFVQELVEQDYKIDILVNNAGRNTHPESDPSQNLPDQRNGLFQANFLGHYQLTAELLQHQRLNTYAPIDDPARIINLSSIMHHFVGANVDVASVNAWRQIMVGHPPTPDNTYSMSKLAMILLTRQLDANYAPHGIRSVAVNPGAVNSDIWRSLPSWLGYLFRIFYLTPAQGAEVSVAAAIRPLPSRQQDLGVVYLQPYPLPYTKNLTYLQAPSVQTAMATLAEIMGPFAGAQASRARLPVADDGLAASEALWTASQQVTGAQWPNAV